MHAAVFHNRINSGILIACSILAVAQAAHFYFYFDQPSLISIKWSIKGSIIWALLLFLVVRLDAHYSTERLPNWSWVMLWIAMALFCSAAQVFIAVFMDFLLGTASRPLKADFLHLYNKRWLQNLLVFGLFFAWWQHARRGITETKERSDADQKIKLIDDDGLHLVSPSEISHLEALGNYVSVQVADKTHIVRSTLTAFERELEQYGFLRISRSALVNTARVNSVIKSDTGQPILVLQGGQELAVGRTFKQAVKEYLNL